MTTKTILKEWLDEAIDAMRGYLHWGAGLRELACIREAAREIECASGIAACAVDSLLFAILRHAGLNQDATNEDIYAVLRLLGWEVSN